MIEVVMHHGLYCMYIIELHFIWEKVYLEILTNWSDLDHDICFLTYVE
jgi:hypothetical protein